jgi:hypothetical protein
MTCSTRTRGAQTAGFWRETQKLKQEVPRLQVRVNMWGPHIDVPLEALPASRRLIVLHPCPFVRLVMANNATRRCAKDAVVTSKMARSTAHHRTFQAALGVRGGYCCQGKESGGATNNRFHLSLQ